MAPTFDIDEDHWRRIEALDRREWPRTKPEIQLLRSALFAAQALARGMIADGRAEEVEQIRRSISEDE